MLDASDLPEVVDQEAVTRYLMFSKWYRADETIKYEAFMPPADLELSVTRLLQATDALGVRSGVPRTVPDAATRQGAVALA